MCPICLTIITKEQTNDLSKDHVPPKSVGGKDIVLTCKKCNNIQGAEIDKHLHQVRNRLSFLNRRPNSNVFEQIQIEGLSSVKSKISITEEGGFYFYIDKENTKPKEYQDFLKMLDSRLPRNITFNIQLGNLRLADLSVIRAAYLYGFMQLGYGFIFNENMGLIRGQIMASNKILLKTKLVFKGDESHPTGIYLANPNGAPKFFLVVFNLGSDRAIVALPSGQTGSLQSIEAYFSSISSISNLDVFSINTGIILIDEEGCILPFL